MRRALKAAALILLLAATAAPADERIHRVSQSRTLDEKTTEKKRFDLLVHAAGRRVSVHVRVVVREGEARIVVRDSKGRVRQDARLRPSSPSKPNRYDVSTDEESAAAGEWTVEVELKEATGRYEIIWTNDLP